MVGVTTEPAAPSAAPASRAFDPVPVPEAWWERVPAPVAWLTVAFLLLLTLVLVVPVPYAIRAPGPTVDTLGEAEGTPLITVTDAETYESEGELRLTTVSVAGGPGFPVGSLQALRAWFDPRQAVVPREAVFPANQTREEADQQSQAQMTSSQENATVAALEALGHEVPTTLTVAGAVPDGPSVDLLEEGDVLVSIAADGATTPLTSFAELSGVLGGTPAGSEVVVGVLRDGEEVEVTVTTGDDGSGGSVLGVLVDPEFSAPVHVEIAISNIGGASAGMMFALGIMDTLTPDDVTGGAVIAGTGTIDLAGEVGPIGGIVQKMNGSVRDGATAFLAPVANCGEVVGNVPAGLQVVAVSTLTEAWDAVTAIGLGQGEGLPTCE